MRGAETVPPAGSEPSDTVPTPERAAAAGASVALIERERSRRQRPVTSATSIDDLDDAALVARAPDEPEAFAVLFHRHVHDVHRFLRRRTGDDALADDLTALVFERCWTALPGFRPHHATLRPWLLRIAANVVASHYRSEGRRRRREHLVAIRDDPCTDGDLTPDRFDDTAVLAGAQ